jgi:hypothetical protein
LRQTALIRTVRLDSQRTSMVDCEHPAKTVEPHRKHRPLLGVAPRRFPYVELPSLKRSASISASCSPANCRPPRGRTLQCWRSSASGSPRLPESLPEQAIGSCSNTLAGGARYRRPVQRIPLGLTRPSWGAPYAFERFKVVREDGPHRAYLDAVQTLNEQQPAHVCFRRVELGGRLGDRKNAWPVDFKILACSRNHFCYDAGTDAPRLLQALRQGAHRNAWHVMPARGPEGKELIMSEQNKVLS